MIASPGNLPEQGSLYMGREQIKLTNILLTFESFDSEAMNASLLAAWRTEQESEPESSLF